MPRLDARILRKRRRLYSLRDLAAVTGLDKSTLCRLENSDPIPRPLRLYLAAVGYRAAFYPIRNGPVSNTEDADDQADS